MLLLSACSLYNPFEPLNATDRCLEPLRKPPASLSLEDALQGSLAPLLTFESTATAEAPTIPVP